MPHHGRYRRAPLAPLAFLLAVLVVSIPGGRLSAQDPPQDGAAPGSDATAPTREAEDTSLTPPASDPAAPFASTATYTIRFRGTWTRAVTPGGLPGRVYFSRLIGAVHNAGATFLESGETASRGVEQMAEVGGTSILRREVTAARNADPPTALSVLEGTGSIGPTATGTLSNRSLTTEFPRVTLTTMIAPSHDWFVGVSGLLLLDASGLWLRSHEVDLYPWDAGTEEGGDFSLDPSVETTPRGAITSIRGTGRFTTERIAGLTFTLQSVRTERSLDEHTGPGVDIGEPVAAVAARGTVTYTLGGPDASLFELVSSTGQLRTKAGVTYDADATSTRTVTVTQTDTDGSIVTTVEIAIENIDETPKDARLASLELSGVDIGEFSPLREEYVSETIPHGNIATLRAVPAREGASLAIEPADHDGDESNGYQLRLLPGLAITITVTSPDGSRERVYRLLLGGEEADQAAGSCLRGEVSQGFSLLLHGGGSLEALDACARERHVTALYATDSGAFVPHVLGAPAVVNRAFSALYAEGIPRATPLLARSEGPRTPDAAADGAVAGIPPADAPGCLAGGASAGFSLLLYEGGSLEELEACARDLGVTALYATEGGAFIAYILGAPAFVNRAFSELHADGLAASTPLLATIEGP